ncbi:MAG: hypothetical protein LBU87_00840 [Lactobacillales bacterium]|jgi:hypothetical protein|nr:hypothetical protein [Lactobacillales bacterium]
MNNGVPFDGKSTLNPKDIYPDWEEMFANPGVAEAGTPTFETPPTDQAYWEKIFKEMNFPGMDLMAVIYFREIDNLPEFHNKFRLLARDFMKFLNYNHSLELRAAGVNDENIFLMKKGFVPENFTVLLKYPLQYGGSLDFSNMVLIQTNPFAADIRRYIDMQLTGATGFLRPKTLYVPVPPGKIYVPFGLFTGSGGKNKQDKSVMAGFTASALKDIALKKMPGR